MSPAPSFGFEQLVTELLRGLAEVVADRPGETEAQKFIRQQTAIFSAMAFLPRDGMETMLANQCVMFDHLLRDATRDLLREQSVPMKLRLGSQILAFGRLFLKCLAEMRQLRARPSERTALSLPADTPLSPTVETACAPKSAEDAISPPQEAPPSGKVAVLQQRGFQNRRMRRAMQQKKPGMHAATTSLSSAGSGPGGSRSKSELKGVR